MQYAKVYPNIECLKILKYMLRIVTNILKCEIEYFLNTLYICKIKKV